MAEVSTIQKIDLSVLRRQRIQIDLGDDEEHILEINTTDLNVVTRLTDGYNKLIELDELVKSVGDSEDIEIDDNDTNETVQNKL